jgi:hypothetical protein
MTEDTIEFKDPDFEINAVEVNALLQARGLGRVGAIMAKAGTPTKNGAKSLFMLRGLAAKGYLQERPVEDYDGETIIYFGVASRADFAFLDQCASAAIVELSTQNAALASVNKTLRETSDKVGDALTTMTVDLSKLESEFGKILSWAVEIEALAGQFAEGETGTPEASAAIEAKAKTVVAQIKSMVGE